MMERFLDRPVGEQEAMIADLDAISRRRPLSAGESDLLAELLRRAAWRQYMRDRRISEQLERAQARVDVLMARVA